MTLPRVGYLEGEQFIREISPGVGTELAGTFQPINPNLTTLAGTITAFGISLVDDANAAAARTTLGLGTMALQNSTSISFTGGGGTFTSSLNIGDGTANVALTFNSTGTTAVRITSSGTPVRINSSNSTTTKIELENAGADVGWIGANATGLTLHDPTSAIKLQVSSTNVSVNGSMKVPSYTVAGAPSAATHGVGSMIYVSNETGGAVIAFSDGVNWRRVTDRAIIA